MATRIHKPFWLLRRLIHACFITLGAGGLTLAFFLVLPVMQTLAERGNTDLLIQTVDVAKIEAPDPIQEPEPEEPEDVEEEEPPELTEESEPLSIEELEMSLNASFGEGAPTGEFMNKLKAIGSESKDVEEIFSIADLDQKPRVIYQPGPQMDHKVMSFRRKAGGKVYVVFVVNAKGRVEKPIVQKSSDPVLEKAAVNCVKKWKFEPGKRNGKAVRFRMRVPITFPKIK